MNHITTTAWTWLSTSNTTFNAGYTSLANPQEETVPYDDDEMDEEDGVAVSVPPVTGLTPAQIAVELREKIRRLYQQVAGGSPGSLAHDAATAKMRMHEYRAQSNDRRAMMVEEIGQLATIAKRRRPSETVAAVARITLRLQSESETLRRERIRADRLAEMAATSGGTQVDVETLKQAYALVQGLPTVDNIAVGNAENSLRAIVAICKAHFGFLEGTIQDAPHNGAFEELATVLLQIVQSESPPEVTGPTPAFAELEGSENF